MKFEKKNLAGSLGLSAGRGTIVVGGASASATNSRNQTSVVANAASNPTKYMFVTSRPSTPVQVFFTKSDPMKSHFILRECV